MKPIESQFLLEMTKMALEHKGWAPIIVAGAVGLVIVLRLGFRWKARQEAKPTKPTKSKSKKRS